MTELSPKSANPKGMPMLPVTPVTLAMETIDISFGSLKNRFEMKMLTIKVTKEIKR